MSPDLCDHPRSSAPGLLLLPQSSLLHAMPHLPPVHHETSKHDSLNETRIKEKQNETILNLNSNLAKSMTHHKQIKKLTTWFLGPAVPGPPPDRGGLWCRHMSRGSRPISRCRRALASPCATWLSAGYGPQAKGKYSAGLLTRLDPPTSEACSSFLEAPDLRLIMTLPNTWSRQHIICIQDSHTRRMGSIKCIQNIDAARR
jgi:hypothetical protein